MAGSLLTVQAQTAASFDASVGVNVHPPYPGTPYADESLWLSQLEAAGFQHVRTNWDENQPTMDAPIEQMAAAGIKVLITSDALYREGETPQSLVNYLVGHPQLAAAIYQIAGPNEVNSSFSDWQTGIAPFMKALYAAIKANPVTAHIQIVSPNFDNMQYDQSLATQIGNISQYVDEGDIHGTNGGDAQDGAYFAQVQQTAATMSGTKPLINTEGGYSAGTDSNGHLIPLPADAIQVDVLRYYFDDFAAGVRSSDLYQMIRQTPGDTSWWDDFSVVNDNGTPTPVYNEIKAVTTLLHDSGTPPGAPGSLSYSVNGADSSTKTLLLQKSDGSFWITYWEDKQYYEYSVADANKGYTHVAPTLLTLQLGSAASGALFNPYSGSTAAVSSFTNTTSISLSATTIPQMIEIIPSPITTPDTLILHMSEDAWNGDAQFTMSVDGKQVGGTQTVNVLHSTGAYEQFTFTGLWGTGTHAVKIAFVNDAYGGTAATDRNLYINSVAYDGTTFVNTTLAEYSNGSTTVTVGGSTPTPTPTPTPDTLTLHLSEDAYLGDAQFTVSVDGKQVGGTLTAHAVHSTGADEQVTLTGLWGAGAHAVQIAFINDAYGGTAATDRNLYINSVAYDGTTFANTTLTEMSNGSKTVTVGGTTPIAAPAPDTLTLHLSEDAYLGDAQFTVSVDGKTLDTPETVTALHAASALQNLLYSGNFGAGNHDIGVTFLNDAYGGSSTMDRNLYVGSIGYDGNTFDAGGTAIMSTGTAHFTVHG